MSPRRPGHPIYAPRGEIPSAPWTTRRSATPPTAAAAARPCTWSAPTRPGAGSCWRSAPWPTRGRTLDLCRQCWTGCVSTAARSAWTRSRAGARLLTTSWRVDRADYLPTLTANQGQANQGKTHDGVRAWQGQPPSDGCAMRTSDWGRDGWGRVGIPNRPDESVSLLKYQMTPPAFALNIPTHPPIPTRATPSLSFELGFLERAPQDKRRHASEACHG